MKLQGILTTELFGDFLSSQLLGRPNRKRRVCWLTSVPHVRGPGVISAVCQRITTSRHRTCIQGDTASWAGYRNSRSLFTSGCLCVTGGRPANQGKIRKGSSKKGFLGLQCYCDISLHPDTVFPFRGFGVSIHLVKARCQHGRTYIMSGCTNPKALIVLTFCQSRLTTKSTQRYPKHQNGNSTCLIQTAKRHGLRIRDPF